MINTVYSNTISFVLYVYELRFDGDPAVTEIDIEAKEAELEVQLMEQAAAERASQAQFLEGRRLTGRKKADPEAAQKKNFWH